MDSQQITFMKLINYQNSVFSVPIYQRKYRWSYNQCYRLYFDIKRLMSQKQLTHFIGTVIYKKDNLIGKSLTTLEIVDSQQRITTLSILLKALMDYYNDTNTVKNRKFHEMIYNQSLINPYDIESSFSVKLKLTHSDVIVYENLLSNNVRECDKNHLIYSNYKFFYNKLKDEKIDPEEFYEALNRLMIIELSLGENDDAQATFESINSTGLKMENADLIRNYIFMGLSHSAQEKIYYGGWKGLEEVFDNDSKKMTEFMRVYLTIKCKEFIKEENVYEVFKDNFSNNDNDIVKKQVSEMYFIAKGYVSIINADTDDSEINKILQEFGKMNVPSFNSVVLQAYLDFQSNKISKNEFIEIVSILSSYLVRRFICNTSNNGYVKVVVGLLNAIREKEYVYSIKKHLKLKGGSVKFPDDNEFYQGFLTTPIYKKNKDLRNYVIYELENYNQNEVLNIESSELSIEHIMPQNQDLSDEWKIMIGENWREVQEKYLHTIGNLTVTGYNSRMSDKPFLEKRDMKKGFRDCPARLNNSLRNLEIWNEDAILKRAEQLFTLALKKWRNLDDVSETMDNHSNVYTINDNWNNKKFKSVSFMEYEQQVANTTEIYKFVIEKVYELDRERFIDFFLSGKLGSKSAFSFEQQDTSRQNFLLEDSGIYICTKIGSNRKRDTIRKILQLMEISEEAIELNT